MAKGTVGYNLAAGVATTILTVPAGYVAEVTYIRIFNRTSSQKSISLDWVGTKKDGTSRTVHLWEDFDLAAKTPLEAQIIDILLRPGDTLVATSEAASTMDIIATFDTGPVTSAVNFEE